jgi:hypothetical protein
MDEQSPDSTPCLWLNSIVQKNTKDAVKSIETAGAAVLNTAYLGFSGAKMLYESL